MAVKQTSTITKNGRAPLPGERPSVGGPEKRGGRQRSSSEYKKSLVEKQALRELYGLSEKQFKRYVKNALLKMQKVQNVSDELIKTLETRLDNVVFRAGLVKTRRQGRQIVSHAFFTVNGKAINTPSFAVKTGDVVAVKESKKKKPFFMGIAPELKKALHPSWIDFDAEKMEVKVKGNPTIAEANPPVEISLIFEFYSR